MFGMLKKGGRRLLGRGKGMVVVRKRRMEGEGRRSRLIMGEKRGKEKKE